MPASVAQELDLPEYGSPHVDCSLQLGDFGIFDEQDYQDGKFMSRYTGKLVVAPDPAKHKIFRGNHDNPSLIRQMPHYLADYGYFEKQDMFVLAGGYSIDRYVILMDGRPARVEGENWWADEQLSEKELTEAVAMFEDAKPKIMISHECPTVVKPYVLTHPNKADVRSRTEAALQVMWMLHKPDLWIFGHHHCRREIYGEHTGGTRFVCLNEMINGPIKECMFEIPGLEW